MGWLDSDSSSMLECNGAFQGAGVVGEGRRE